MAEALTPSDSDYYARPRSKKDEGTLKCGWRALTKKEARKFIDDKRKKHGDDIQVMDALRGYENGKFSLRWYRGYGVCVYIKETDSFFSLEKGDEVEKTGITLSDLRNTKKGLIWYEAQEGK